LDKVFIKDLVVNGILGVHAWERQRPREIVVNLELSVDISQPGVSDDIVDCVDYQQVAEKISAHVRSAERFTVEALATDLARISLEHPGVSGVKVRIDKPGAVPSCRSVGVEIERRRDHGNGPR
jgi:FolB domain-containing protein